DVGDRRVGDPHLAALEDVAAGGLGRAGAHAGGIGAGVGLGQAEAADPLAARQLGQELLPLGLRAVGVDRVHDQARLHAHGGAVAGVHALDLAGDQAVADIVHAGAAIAVDGGAEQAELAQLVHDRAVEALVPVGFEHARHELVLRILARGVPPQALILP